MIFVSLFCEVSLITAAFTIQLHDFWLSFKKERGKEWILRKGKTISVTLFFLYVQLREHNHTYTCIQPHTQVYVGKLEPGVAKSANARYKASMCIKNE